MDDKNNQEAQDLSNLRTSFNYVTFDVGNGKSRSIRADYIWQIMDTDTEGKSKVFYERRNNSGEYIVRHSREDAIKMVNQAMRAP
jgi:hypothetical protein